MVTNTISTKGRRNEKGEEEERTADSSSMRHSLPSLAAMATRATYWMDILFPKPSPGPSIRVMSNPVRVKDHNSMVQQDEWLYVDGNGGTELTNHGWNDEIRSYVERLGKLLDGVVHIDVLPHPQPISIMYCLSEIRRFPSVKITYLLQQREYRLVFLLDLIHRSRIGDSSFGF